MRLPDDYIADCERRARRYQGQWTGTAGSMAADSMRLQIERRELVATIAELEHANAALRAAVESRLQGGEEPPVDPAAAGVPAEFLAKHAQMTFVPAALQKPAEFGMECVSATLTPEQLEAVWGQYREKQAQLHARIRGEVPSEPIKVETIQRRRQAVLPIIGLTGPAGCGKTTVAGMIEGAAVIQLADPLYAALALMLGVDEAILRHRAAKEKPLPGLDRSPRQLLQTLGTDWGRAFVGSDVWLRQAGRRIDALHAAGAATVIVADVRFENEAEWIRHRGGQVWRVEREPATAAAPHASEAGIPYGLIDRTIDNTGSAEETRLRVAEALKGDE